MISLDIINDKLISVEVSGDEIVINVLRAAPTTYDALTDTPASKIGNALKYVRVNADETLHEYSDLINDLGALTEAANIAINCQNQEQTEARIAAMTRVATTLTFSNFGKVFNLSMTKNNGDLDLIFTLAGGVFDVFDNANNVYTRATTVTIAGTDLNQSWELSFKQTNLGVIQVVGTIDAFA